MKGTNKKVPLGSGHLYYSEYTEDIKEKTAKQIIDEICKDENRLGYIQGGASVEYKPTFQTEKDDLGIIIKEILTEEEAVFKTGLFTWNGDSLKTLSPTARVKEDKAEGLRIVKIGGVDNDNGKYYVIVFHHKDKDEGDCWLIIVGRNTAGFTLTYKKDSPSVIDAEFTCKPQDSEGTLITYVEEIEKEVPTKELKESYTQEDLEAMTIAEIKAVAQQKGYSITGTVKADLITSFLAVQTAGQQIE